MVEPFVLVASFRRLARLALLLGLDAGHRGRDRDQRAAEERSLAPRCFCSPFAGAKLGLPSKDLAATPRCPRSDSNGD
jgi:hypothetical protein